MNATCVPVRLSGILLTVALALLLDDGIAMTVMAAQPTREPPRTPITSAGTMVMLNGKVAAVSASAMQEGTLSKCSPPGGWPAPVDDQARRLFTLVDVLEYRPKAGGSQGGEDYRWDIQGWYGGDYNRLWFKSEGQRDTAFKADYDVDFQLLYGRFIQKYYDFQIGPRVETQSFRGSNVTRGLAVIGIEGLVP